MFDNAGMETVAKSSLVDDGWFLFWLVVALALVVILVLCIIITVIELVDALEGSFPTLIISSWSSTRA